MPRFFAVPLSRALGFLSFRMYSVGWKWFYRCFCCVCSLFLVCSTPFITRMSLSERASEWVSVCVFVIMCAYADTAAGGVYVRISACMCVSKVDVFCCCCWWKNTHSEKKMKRNKSDKVDIMMLWQSLPSNYTNKFFENSPALEPRDKSLCSEWEEQKKMAWF